MKKIIINNIDEMIYKHTLKNGIDVYMYPTDKTKNFYITISVKYGANVKEYSLNGERKTIKPGTAHFLEHKIMNFTGREDLTKLINELGLYANAYTSYELTNYNLFGSKDINTSLKLLLDLFYNPIINDNNVKNEKGIISEEYKMYNDNPNFRINRQVNKNVFKNSFLNDTLVGNIKEIDSITRNDLLEVYDNIYTTNNTFIILTGNFNKNEVINYLEEYMKKIKPSKEKDIKIKYPKESKNVVASYMEITENISIPRVIYSLKIPKKSVEVKGLILKRYYLNLILSSLFSATSDIYEKYKQNGLMISMSSSITNEHNYYLLNLSILTKEPDKLIDELKNDIKNPDILQEVFERKKKMFLNNLVLSFENIEDVEFLITNNIIRVGRITNDAYDILNSMNYKELSKVIKSIDFNNYSILKIIPKK